MDSRLKKLKINFPSGWIDISRENPDGPPTFIDDRLNNPGVLQISIAEYISGQKPNPDYTDLISVSENIGLRNEFGQITNKDSGICDYGKYGKVEFSKQDYPYICVWLLSNGLEFVFSTFICSDIPSESEKRDVENILKSIKEKDSLF